MPNDYYLKLLEYVVTLRPGTVARNVELVVGVMGDKELQYPAGEDCSPLTSPEKAIPLSDTSMGMLPVLLLITTSTSLP